MLVRRMDRHQVSVGLLMLRVFGGTLLVLGRSRTWTEMVAVNAELAGSSFSLGGELGWFLTLFAECLCTILVMLGVFTRFTAVPPLVAMAIQAMALPFGTAWSVRELYLLYALPFFVLSFTGPGDYSVDGRLSSWASR